LTISPAQYNSIPFQYARDVLAGNIVVGNKIKLAVKRFYQWIDDADKDGFYLDHKAGLKVIDFFPAFLKHTKGPLAKHPAKEFTLSPYQQFTAYNIFAWKKQENGLRRINTVYDKQARKNGKTAFLAGLGLYVIAFEGQSSPEVFVGATKEAQAKLLWDQAYDFIQKSPALRYIGFKTFQREIKFPRNIGSFKFLGGDSKTQDGLNPSLSLIDEYHAHKDDGVREVLESAMGARLNPLTYLITTAGTNVYSVCKAAEDTYVEILEGEKTDHHTFIMIHDLDDGDDWEDENNWKKANPNMDYNPPMLAHLRKEFIKAKNQLSKKPNFQTKHLNMWVDAPEIWIPNEIFQSNKVTDFEGYDNYDDLFFAKAQKYGSWAGCDLSKVIDLSSVGIITNADEKGNHYIKSYNFCPKDIIDARSREDNVPYRHWADLGLLIATPGNTVDYTWIEDKICDVYPKYNIERIGFDPYNASHIVQILQERNINVDFYQQNIMNMSFPSKQFEKKLYEGKLKHDGSILLAWALSGVVIYEDANENIKLHKGRSHKGKKRIDPIVALVMAIGEMLSAPEETNESKYNNPDEEISFGLNKI